jgi:aquaporin NIP
VKKLVAEAIGTFALVFVGTGAIVVDQVSGGVVTHVGIALAFGLVVMTMIYAVGDVSGAHFNPAVTVCFWLARRLPGNEVAPYVAAQSAGALLASGVLRLLFSNQQDLGATVPIGAASQSFTLETILTFFLMFVILAVSTGARERGITAGIAIGATVCLAALFGGPISGASMNPARSLGPAAFSGALAPLWLYVTAPLLGAMLAVVGCRCVREPGCCDASSPRSQ